MKKKLGLMLSGAAAGAVNGFFGAGGGTVLVPLMRKLSPLPEEEIFPAGLTVMIPICLTSLLLSRQSLPFLNALPYLLGSFLGGLITGRLHVKPKYLHRLLGILILAGGVKLLWS